MRAVSTGGHAELTVGFRRRLSGEGRAGNGGDLGRPREPGVTHARRMQPQRPVGMAGVEAAKEAGSGGAPTACTWRGPVAVGAEHP